MINAFEKLLEICEKTSFEDLLIQVENSIPLGYTTSFCFNFKAQGLFRARLHNHVEGFFNEEENIINSFKQEGEFWNRPLDEKNPIPLGRCNIENESVFYCSTDMATAILEVKPQKGEFISVASFELKNILPFNGSRMNFIGRSYLSKIPTLSNLMKLVELPSDECNLTDDFLDRLFHKNITEDNKYLYKLSAAVTKCMMKYVNDETLGKIPMNGLIYPSIERDKKNFNIMYKPEHVRLHYSLAEVKTFEVIENNVEEIKLSLNRIGYTIGTKYHPMDNFQMYWEFEDNQTYLVKKNQY